MSSAQVRRVVERPTEVRGPFFDELHVGQVFADAPSVTITDGLCAAHRAVVGNRLRLTLDDVLAAEVTGHRGLVSPAVAWDVSIGQSSIVTQKVKANLFYKGLYFHRHPHVGDTLRTTTTVEALRANRSRPGRWPTGVAVLHIETIDQHGRLVLDYRRAAMLPMSHADANPPDLDDQGDSGDPPSLEDLMSSTRDWDLGAFRRVVDGPHHHDLRVGDRWRIEGPDVVTGATGLARLTGNVAAIHHDGGPQGASGRLVYGGHTIGVALHQLTRALPALVTVAGWHGCDHIAPVHEEDRLVSTIEVQGLATREGGGGLVDLRVVVEACAEESTPVLDWRLSAVLA